MAKPTLSLVPDAPPMNRILAALSAEERGILEPHLETVPLRFRQDLYEAGQPVEYVYFPHSGVGSMLTEMPGGTSVEIATVGPEGMIGMPVVPRGQADGQQGLHPGPR